MKMEPGYDGQPPIIVELRDLEGRKNGKNKRRLIMRVKPGIWQKRLNRGIIAAHQKDAVDRLEHDCNSALRIAFSSAGDGIGGTLNAGGPQMSKLEAMERMKRAKTSVVDGAGALGWQVVDYAVMFDYSFELIAKKTANPPAKCRSAFAPWARCPGPPLRDGLVMGGYAPCDCGHGTAGLIRSNTS